MNATGNFKPGDITPAKLLGKDERPAKRAATPVEAKMPVNEFFDLLKAEQRELSDGATR